MLVTTPYRSFSSLAPYPIWPPEKDGEQQILCDAGPLSLTRSLPADARVERVALEPDGQLALKVKSRSNTVPTGGQVSLKTKSVVHWKSPAEGHLAKLLECEPMVTYFGAQPATIYYTLDGEQKQRHVPDMLCRGGRYPILWEVKTERDAWRDDIALRSALMARDLPMFGFAYRVVLAKDLRLEPRMSNLKQIRRLARLPVTDIARETARRLFAERRTITWGQVSNGVFGALGLPSVCRLLWEGALWVNVDARITHDTPVLTMAMAAGD